MTSHDAIEVLREAIVRCGARPDVVVIAPYAMDALRRADRRAQRIAWQRCRRVQPALFPIPLVTK